MPQMKRKIAESLNAPLAKTSKPVARTAVEVTSRHDPIDSPARRLQLEIASVYENNGEAVEKYPVVLRIGGLILFCGAAWGGLFSLMF